MTVLPTDKAEPVAMRREARLKLPKHRVSREGARSGLGLWRTRPRTGHDAWDGDGDGHELVAEMDVGSL